jgi:hypothetical protein
MENRLIHSELYNSISELIEQSRKQVAQSVNLTVVYTYYEIGRHIVEDEQKGSQRAEYGKAVLKELSKRLSGKYGRGFSEDNLDRMKKFYLMYSPHISATLSRKLQTNDDQQHNFIKTENTNTVSPIDH